jgi:LmbE family N-acetylglucosaminyl deacetylase
MKTLIVVAHMDDESFGLGGTITKMCREGNPNDLKILSFCNGRKMMQNKRDREDAFERVITDLGCIGVWSEYDDLSLPQQPLSRLADTVAEHIQRHKPEHVICTSEDDIHQDHVMVSKATRIACRPFNQSTVKSLYEFKIPSSSRAFGFNIASDIGGYIEEKIKLIEYYNTEVKDNDFHPMSINGVIGINHADGVNYGLRAAELLRVVWSCKKF